MYTALLVFEDKEFLDEIKNLDFWGNESDFQIADIAQDALEGYIKVKNVNYNMIMIQADLKEMEGISLVKCIADEHISGYMVLCSKERSFEQALFGIKNNVFDFIVSPVSENDFMNVIGRIKNELYIVTASQKDYLNEIYSLFKKQDKHFKDFVDKAVRWAYEKYAHIPTIDTNAMNQYDYFIDCVFEEYDWLELYVIRDELRYKEENESNELASYISFYQNNLYKIFDCFCEIYKIVPQAQIAAAILYILNNPEAENKQTEIAEKIMMNSSVFSTLFKAHTNEYYGVYLADVKLRRGACILRNESIKSAKVSEILKYKDVSYFGRLFKQKFGMSPTEYQNKFRKK